MKSTAGEKIFLDELYSIKARGGTPAGAREETLGGGRQEGAGGALFGREVPSCVQRIRATSGRAATELLECSALATSLAL